MVKSWRYLSNGTGYEIQQFRQDENFCRIQAGEHGGVHVWWNEAEEKEEGEREVSKRKIELMHEMFGKNEKYCCAECDHFRKISYHDKTYRKCEVYGLTRSEATDWKASNVACGLAPNKTYTGRNVVEMVATHKDADEPIIGKMSITDYFGGG